MIKGVTKAPKPAEEGGALTPAQQIELTKFNKIADRARLLIIDSIDDKLATKLFYGTTETSDPSAMWSLIIKTFNKKETMCQQLAMTRFLSFKIKTNRSYQENLDRFSNLLTEAVEAGVSLDSKIQLQTLIQALPPVWNPIILAWATREESDREVNKLIEIIKVQAARMFPEEEVSDASAMLLGFKYPARKQTRKTLSINDVRGSATQSMPECVQRRTS